MSARRRNSAIAIQKRAAVIALRPKWSCGHCGLERVATAHQTRQTYCSKKCMAKAYKERLRGGGNPNFRNAGWYVCEQCKALFHDRNKRRFCSLQCRDGSEFYMRGRCRKDKNHKQMVDAIEAAGGKVLDISIMGQGVPDLIVQTMRGIQLAEVKNPENAYGKRGLTESQKKWAGKWLGGPVYVLRTEQNCKDLVVGDFHKLDASGGIRLQQLVETQTDRRKK